MSEDRGSAHISVSDIGEGEQTLRGSHPLSLSAHRLREGTSAIPASCAGSGPRRDAFFGRHDFESGHVLEQLEQRHCGDLDS